MTRSRRYQILAALADSEDPVDHIPPRRFKSGSGRRPPYEFRIKINPKLNQAISILCDFPLIALPRYY
jgi:hypothetical protein